jgi:hypothetical protein
VQYSIADYKQRRHHHQQDSVKSINEKHNNSSTESTMSAEQLVCNKNLKSRDETKQNKI